MLVWDKIDERTYESGLDRGVLYSPSGLGVVWNGLQSVNEKPVGGTTTSYYYDGVLYYNHSTMREFSMNVKALSYPKEFDECMGLASVSGVLLANQPKKSFGMSYRTMVDASDYKLHLVYNCLVRPDSVTQGTVDRAIKPNSYSWNVVTTPPEVTGRANTAHVVLDSRKMSPAKRQAVEDILYGTAIVAPALPTQIQLNTLMTV